MSDALTILIPTHGRPTLIRRTLDSLAACRLPAGYRETVVVENGPPAGSEAVVVEASRAHPGLRLRYLHVERANKSHALNVALDSVEEGLVVFFDDDVRLDPDVLVAYAEAASAASEQAFFGGTAEVDYETMPPAWLIPALPLSARGMDVGAKDWPGWFLGFNWAATVEDLRSAGGFDPDVGPGSPTGALGQETTMQNRLRKEGLVAIPVPEAKVWHYVPQSRASADWVIARRYQLGVTNGRAIAAGRRRNTMRGDLTAALRSISLLPAFLLVRNEPRILAHQLVVTRARGLLRGYLTERLSTSSR